MAVRTQVEPTYADGLDDHALVALALAGQRDAFRHIMQRCIQRLFRTARAVIGDDSEAEEILQESYMHASGTSHRQAAADIPYRLHAARGGGVLGGGDRHVARDQPENREDAPASRPSTVARFTAGQPGHQRVRGIPVHGSALCPRQRRGDGTTGRRTVGLTWPPGDCPAASNVGVDIRRHAAACIEPDATP